MASGTLDLEDAQTLVELLVADTPARHVRVVLAYHRRRGVSFDLAWASALRSIPRNDVEVPEWRDTLRWARASYQQAYEAGLLEHAA